MSSTTISEVNGMVVVTQVFPKAGGGGEAERPESERPESERLESERLESEQRPPDYAAAKVSEMTSTFLRGQPQALGIAQVFVGFLCMSSGLVGIVFPTQAVQIPLMASVMFVVSGSVAVAARRGTSISMIRATLGLHVLSALVSMAGMVFLSWLLATQAYQPQLCQEDPVIPSVLYATESYRRSKCHDVLWVLQRTLSGVWGLVLFLTTSEFCIAVSLCVFSGRALSRGKNYMVTAASPTSMSTNALLAGAVMA